MKIASIYKPLFVTVSAIIIAGCDGASYDYGEDTQDLAQCIVGDTWESTYENEAMGLPDFDSIKTTYTYYEDGTYNSDSVRTGYNKTSQASLALLFYAATADYSFISDILEDGFEDKYEVTIITGNWETEGDLLYKTPLKVASASGNYEQATHNEALSLFESTPENEDGTFAYPYRVHCDDHHLDADAWKLTNSNPLTYKHERFFYYDDLEQATAQTSVLTLNDDGTGSMHVESNNIDGSVSQWNTVGLYEYVLSTPDELISVKYHTCKNDDIANCLKINSQTFFDRGTALTETEYFFTH